MSDLDEFDAVDEGQGAGDPKRVKRSKKVTKDEANQTHEYWRQVLETVAGRAVIWEILENCHVFSKIFAGELVNTTSHREGKREVGIDIFETLLQVAPDSYTLMRREALDRESRKETKIDG